MKKEETYILKTNEKHVNFRLLSNTRIRMSKSFKSSTKQSSRDLLGINIETYRRWIVWQMTPEMKWSNIEIDHVKPICMFDVSKDEELREAFCWKNNQPLLKKGHQYEGIKFNFLDYQLQFIKCYELLKLNEEGHNESSH